MFIRKTSDRFKKAVVWIVAAAFVLSTGIIGIYALVDRRSGGVPSAMASDIASVNGRGIDYWSFIENFYAVYQQYPYFSPGESQYWLRSYVLDQMIARELLRAEAERSSIKVDEAVVNETIDGYKALFSDSDEFRDYLMSRGMTEADLRRSVRSSLMIEAYVEKLQEQAVVTERSMQSLRLA